MNLKEIRQHLKVRAANIETKQSRLSFIESGRAYPPREYCAGMRAALREHPDLLKVWEFEVFKLILGMSSSVPFTKFLNKGFGISKELLIDTLVNRSPSEDLSTNVVRPGSRALMIRAYRLATGSLKLPTEEELEILLDSATTTTRRATLAGSVHIFQMRKLSAAFEDMGINLSKHLLMLEETV